MIIVEYKGVKYEIPAIYCHGVDSYKEAILEATLDGKCRKVEE